MTSIKRFLYINKSVYFNVTISQKVWFSIWNKDIQWDTKILYWCNSLFLGALTILCNWSRECGKNGIALVRAMDTSAIVTLRGVRVPMLGECTWPAVILSHMVIVIAPAAWARVRPRTRAQRKSWIRATLSSGQIARAQQRGLVIMHGLVALFLGVIVLAIILLVVGLVALWVLVVTLRTIVALIVSMRIVGLAIIAIASVALMVVMIRVTTMLPVAWVTATRGLFSILSAASCLW